jgi:ABC-2 type transport system ATP-binding protein
VSADQNKSEVAQAEALPLRVDGVVKRFGAVTAVAGVSFEIQPGACFGLLGPNGAGKSTLIRSIVGRVRLDAGSISIFGQPVSSSAARAELGWVPQELAVYPLLTCRENLEAFGKYQGLGGRKLSEAIVWCLEWAALADRAGSPVKTLSGGMKRRLNMAAGLIHRPKLVLLDEPTVGVDPQSRNRIFEMVEALRSSGTTIIYTTHYMEEAERLCDWIAIIDRSSVMMRFGVTRADLRAWAAAHEGTAEDGVVHCSVEKPAEIAELLEAASRDGLEVLDVALQRPNLESVFLHLTGKDLRA